jgi:hypothetical protein
VYAYEKISLATKNTSLLKFEKFTFKFEGMIPGFFGMCNFCDEKKKMRVETNKGKCGS